MEGVLSTLSCCWLVVVGQSDFIKQSFLIVINLLYKPFLITETQCAVGLSHAGLLCDFMKEV